MKKTYLLIVINLCIYSIGFSQKNMVSGFIIKESGDTIRGKIDDKEWSRNPTKILFAPNGSEPKTYDVIKELLGFGIDNKSIYIRKTTSLDITPYTYGSLLQTNELIVASDTTIALKLLVKGKISLYYFKDVNSKDHFFVEKLNEPLEELIKHDYMGEYKGNSVVVKEDKFNNQLAELCQDCSLFNGVNFNYQYTQSSLKPAILEYNRFFGDKNAYETTKKETFSSNLFIQVGAGQYSYRTDFGGIYESPSNYFIPSIGLGWFVEIPSNRRRLALKLDATYSVFGDIQKYSNTLPEKKSQYFGLSFSPQYALYKNENTKKIFYVTAGMSWETPLNNTENINPLYPINAAMYGFKGGLGYRIKKLNLEGFYLYSGTGRRLGIPQNSIYRFMFTIGYAIF
jgi:hypothetical protein